MFTPRQTERIVKGFANHRRVTMMELLHKELNFPYKTFREDLE
jgi:hypothetical protein